MTDRIPPTAPWYALSASATVDDLNTDPDHGPSPDERMLETAHIGTYALPGLSERPPILPDMRYLAEGVRLRQPERSRF
jgi:hypothetical protein